MRQRMPLLLLALVATLGCVAFPAKRTPKLDRPRVAPELQDAPAVRLVVNDQTSEPKKAAKSLERARKKFPYLATATEETSEPDYTIELTVENNVLGKGINELAAYTMWILPMIATAEVSVRATVKGRRATRSGPWDRSESARESVRCTCLWRFR